MKLRQANNDDCAALTSLHAASFTASWSHADMTNFVKNDVILIKGEPIFALAIIGVVAGEGEILTFAVAPERRGQREASVFLAEVVDYCVGLGVARLFLEVAIDNIAAVALYTHCGFEQVGVRKAYYNRLTEPAVDALVLALTLRQHSVLSK